MFRKLVSVTMVGALALAACAPAATPTPAPAQPRSGPLNVVATFSIIGDWVQAVAGDKVNLTVLVGADSDAHTFAPSPADGVAVQNAHFIFENGLEFEGWLDGLYVSSNAMGQRVTLSEGLEPLAMAEGTPKPTDEHGDEHGHDDHAHGEFDPHLWQSVPNAMHMVKIIRDTLSTADPANAATYAQNAAAYLAELEALDAFIRAEVEKLPADQRKLVTSHDTLGYFAAAYGFEMVGTALGSMSTEAADPSAGALAELVKDIRATGVRAIFAENVANTRLMDTLANEAGVTLAPTLYTDALGAAGSNGATYVAMMRYNVQTMVTALAP